MNSDEPTHVININIINEVTITADFASFSEVTLVN